MSLLWGAVFFVLGLGMSEDPNISLGCALLMGVAGWALGSLMGD